MDANDAIKYLREKIRSYENKISGIIAQIDTLDAELSQTEALLNSARILLKDEQGKGQTSGRLTDEPLSERLAVLSFSEAIAEIVNSSDGPIHADQVLKKLREAGKLSRAKNPKNSVVSLLHRGVKSGLFDKVGPNLYAPIKELKE
jgi:hypothetical protein